MKQISTWASQNIRQARLLIIIIKVTLFLLAVYAGLLLASNGNQLPASIVYPVVICVFLVVLALYPTQRRNYIRQKCCDFLLPLCSFAVICCAVNNAGSAGYYTKTFASTTISDPTAAQILASGKAKNELTKKEKRILKHEFKKQLKNYVVAKVKNDQQKANDSWKIVLAIIVLLGLLSLLAALTCSLSCNGSDAAAVIIGILGLAGLIWAFVAFINHLKRPKKEPKLE